MFFKRASRPQCKGVICQTKIRNQRWCWRLVWEWKCDGARTPIKLALCYRHALCPLFPRQLTRTKHADRASQIFCGECLPSGWPIVSPPQSSKRKKEEMSAIPSPCSPLRGHRFIGTRSPISFVKEYLKLACFAAGPSCSGLIYTRFSADSRSSLTKNLAQPSPLLATCTFAIRTSRSLRYLVPPKWYLATPIDLLPNYGPGTSKRYRKPVTTGNTVISNCEKRIFRRSSDLAEAKI